MSFTDQKPFIATEENIHSPWNGYRDGRNFRCGFCGKKFKVGDIVRWVYTNDSNIKGVAGNPFVCSECDAPHSELIKKLSDIYQEFIQDKFWRLRERN